MRKLILSFGWLSWLLFSSLGYALEGNDIIGEWITEDKDCRVQIFKKGQHYFGKIAALKYPYYMPGELSGMDGKPRLDSRNQNEALRSRPMVGIELMKNFQFDASNKWSGGSIYDPKNGKTYNCEISLAENGTLLVRGYIGVSLLGRTAVWESAKAYCKRELAFLGVADCSCR